MSEITDIVRKVFIKSGLNSVDEVLRFRIWTHNQNLLKIDISNDKNPLFQCFIELTEAKFKEIREGQDINISSLDNLKSELIKLFLRCEGKDEKEARFFLLLEEAGNPTTFQGYDIVRRKQLKIVEKSALKNLVHFTFDVVDATDEEIKTALIGQIDGLKNLYRITDAKVNELELKLLESREQVNAKLDELAAVRRELELLSTTYENEKRELIGEVGETECKLKREFEKKFKIEKEDFQKQHKNEIDHLKHQQKELRAENKTLKQSLDELQSSLQNETQRCGILEVRLGNTLQEIEQLKSNNAKLDTDYHDKEKNVYTLRTRLAVCEQELKDKACFISSLQKQTDKAVSEKEYLQKYTQDLEKELSFRDETVSKLAKDILKANEIIARQAAELDTAKDKVKVATSVAFEQEKVLKQRGEDISRLEKELETEKSNVEKLSRDKDALSKEIEMINESLTLCKKKTDIDSKVIAWFSRALRFYSSPEDSNAQVTNSTPLSDIGASVRANIIGANTDVNTEAYGKLPSHLTTSHTQQDNAHWGYGTKIGNAALDKQVPDFVLSRLSDIQNDFPADEQGKRLYKPQDYRTAFQENSKEIASKIPAQPDIGLINMNRVGAVPSSNPSKETLHKNHVELRNHHQPVQLANDYAPLESDRSGSRKTTNSRKEKEVGRRFPGSSSYFQ